MGFKKLIYFTLGNNLGYVEMAKLCIDSLIGCGYDGDILFITDMIDEIKRDIKINNNILFHKINPSGLLESSANKLKIYEFPNIQEYDKIIYSDLDILWLKSPDIIFDSIIEDKIYITEENSLMCDEYWGGRILEINEKEFITNNNIKGLNAGFFCFNSSLISVFKDIDEFLIKNSDKINICLEQPFINTYLFRNNLYNTTLNLLISHNGYNLKTFNGVLLHFAGGPGSYNIKLDKMKNFNYEYH